VIPVLKCAKAHNQYFAEQQIAVRWWIYKHDDQGCSVLSTDATAKNSAFPIRMAYIVGPIEKYSMQQTSNPTSRIAHGGILMLRLSARLIQAV